MPAAPPPERSVASAPIAVSSAAPATPWWVPPWPVFLAAGLFAMTWWIMWMLAPAKGEKPSELFNMLAQAIVLTAFIGGVVGTVYTATRDGQKKNDVIATQSQIIAAQATPPSGA